MAAGGAGVAREALAHAEQVFEELADSVQHLREDGCTLGGLQQLQFSSWDRPFDHPFRPRAETAILASDLEALAVSGQVRAAGGSSGAPSRADAAPLRAYFAKVAAGEETSQGELGGTTEMALAFRALRVDRDGGPGSVGLWCRTLVWVCCGETCLSERLLAMVEQSPDKILEVAEAQLADATKPKTLAEVIGEMSELVVTAYDLITLSAPLRAEEARLPEIPAKDSDAEAAERDSLARRCRAISAAARQLRTRAGTLLRAAGLVRAPAKPAAPPPAVPEPVPAVPQPPGAPREPPIAPAAAPL